MAESGSLPKKGLNIFDPATKNFSVYNPAVWDPHAIDPFQYGLYYDNSGVMWIWGRMDGR